MNTHYFSKKQDTRYEEIDIKFYLKKRNIEVNLKSAHGIFSKNKLDNGSELLIDHCKLENDWKILDLGCGFGAIGISLALYNQTIKVDMCDVNERATKLSRKNVKNQGLRERIKVLNSDIYSKIEDKDYDSILINPPQTAGKIVCNKMIVEAKEHLKEGGYLQIVARHQKGGRGFEELMQKTYGNVETIAKGSGFRIYCSQKKQS